MAEYSKLGSPVKQELISQLTQRESVFSRNMKTREDMQLLNSNTAWVKLRSSVNQISSEQAKLLAESIEERPYLTGSPEKARSFVLIGGEQAVNKGARGGVSREKGVIDTTKAYNNYNSIGIRPMPGITSFKAKSKNVYGTLMEAEVKFTVWTVEDLEICELLYFRPGYTALLEWGHSIYVDNAGSIRRAGVDYQTIPDSLYFDAKRGEQVKSTPLIYRDAPGWLESTISAWTDVPDYAHLKVNEPTIHRIDNLLEEYRKKADGNYDGMFGFIRNFSYSFRRDGGYDCTVNIVSKGVILDSLKPSNTSDKTPTADSTTKEEDRRKRKSAYHYCFHYMEADRGPGEFDGKEQIAKAEKKDGGHIASLLDSFPVFAMKQDLDGEGALAGFFDKTIKLQYIRLGDLCMMFNALNPMEDPYQPRKSVYKVPSISTAPGNKFLTFPEHYAVDPIIAVPPKRPTGKDYSEFYIKYLNLHFLMEREAKSREGTDEVLNIMVSTHFVEGVLNHILDGVQEGTVGMFDVLKSILKGITAAFGNVNDFDLHYDHVAEQYVIVDRNEINPDIIGTIPQINVSGLSNTINSVDISSKISSNISAQVAIAAQGNTGNYKENVATILEWNKGAIDRHLPIRSPSNVKTTHEFDKRREQFLKDLAKIWRDFNGAVKLTRNYDPSKIEDIRSEANADLQSLAKSHRRLTGKAPTGVIPVELSMELIGVSGFVIGTTFRINKGLLPRKYDNWAYIVTGIEHEITENNRWNTRVKTQFFPIRID